MNTSIKPIEQIMLATAKVEMGACGTRWAEYSPEG